MFCRSKCDRQRPCSFCSARGQICTYAENHPTTGSPKPSSTAVPTVHDRLVQLERLVASMMPKSPNERPNASSSAEVCMPPVPVRITPAETMPIDTPVDGQSECGSMRISESELRYVGGEHWVAILDGIADLKDHLDREEQLRLAQSSDRVEDEHGVGNSSEPFARPRSNGAFLLYRCRRATSRDEILSALPPKNAVDRYISRYFNYLDLVSSCRYTSIHCCQV
jgi:hypothetical protein